MSTTTKNAAAKDDASASELAREAASQWGTAMKLGLKMIVPAFKAARKIARARKAGGAIAEGAAGKAASAIGSSNGASSDSEVVSVPIQESVTVAAPVALVYELATRFDDYPSFLAHVDSVESASEDEVELELSLRGMTQEVAIEIFERHENERIDWVGTEGIAHAGCASFHAVAPRLTHVELSVDLEEPTLAQRLSRAFHIADHAVRTEMRRFKAYVELYEGEGDEEFEAEGDEDLEEGDEEPEEEDLEGDGGEDQEEEPSEDEDAEMAATS